MSSLAPPVAVPPSLFTKRGRGGVGWESLELIRNFLQRAVKLQGMAALLAPPPSALGGKIGHLSLGPQAHKNATSRSPAIMVIQAIYSDPC